MIFGLAFLFWGASGFEVSGFWCFGPWGILGLRPYTSKIAKHGTASEGNCLQAVGSWDAMLVLLVLLHCGYG